MRTIINLPADQVSALAALCKAKKISRAEAIRRALADLLTRKRLQKRDQAFGSWKKRGHSRDIVADLRREWGA